MNLFNHANDHSQGGLLARLCRIDAIQAAGLVVGGVFLVAATSKALAPMQFAMVIDHVLNGLDLGPLVTRGMAVSLVTLEACIGAMYVFQVAGRAAHRLTLGLLIGFAAVLAWMWIDPPKQGCGCIGFWIIPDDPRREVVVGVARNIGLMACVIATMHAKPILTGTPGKGHSRASASHMSGFSLIELLCVIVVLSIVIALVVPSLAGARRNNRRMIELSHARDVYTSVTLYTSDAREFFPFCATPGRLRGRVHIAGESFRTDFFSGQARLYINLLAPTYLSSSSEVTLDNPLDPDAAGLPLGIVRSSVLLTYSAFSHPDYWLSGEPPRSPSLLRGGMWSYVRFPSSKGLLLDLRAHNRSFSGLERGHAPHPWGIIWADGAGVLRTTDLDTRYRTVERPTAMFDWPVLATENGLAGRDFELATSGTQ